MKNRPQNSGFGTTSVSSTLPAGKGHGPHGPDGEHGMPGTPPAYTFTFSADNASVTAMNRVGATQSIAIDTAQSTFATTVGVNDLGVNTVVGVAETHTVTGHTDTRLFSDQDGDGRFTEVFDIHVATAADARAGQHTFTFNADGSIASDIHVCGTTSHAETIDSNEVYAQLSFAGDTYVVKTVSDVQGYHFEVFRDDNADGVWTEVAGGHSSGVGIDTTTGAVTLVGIESYLAAASAVIG